MMKIQENQNVSHENSCEIKAMRSNIFILQYNLKIRRKRANIRKMLRGPSHTQLLRIHNHKNLSTCEFDKLNILGKKYFSTR